MMITCISRVRHGDTQLTASGTGTTRSEALNAAVNLTNVGYKPGPGNLAGAHELLARWEKDERPAHHHGVIRSSTGYAYLGYSDDFGPRISIGWVDFTFTEEKRVRLWAISAQVIVDMERSDWSASRQVPTFYLDPAVQGITDVHHAIRIGHEILSTAGPVDSEHVRLNVFAEPIY